MKKNLLMALAAMTLFSCSKENDSVVPDLTGTKNVSLSIARMTTRAVDDPDVADKTYTAVEDGVIYFFDQSDAKVFTRVLTEEELTALSSNDHEDAVIVVAVPQSATSIVMIANYKASTANEYSAITAVTKTGISETAIAVGTQISTGVEKVILSGTATIKDVDVNATPPTAAADITITPIVSRLEIAGIAAKHKTEGQVATGEINSFRLLGVFIPNYYATGYIVEGIGQGNLVKPTTVADYDGNTEPFDAKLFDYKTDGHTLPLEEGKSFAYHTFPATGVTNLPNIVLKVDQVTYNTGLVADASYENGAVQYLTVSDYYTEANKGGDKVSNFNAAMIYRINSLLFGLENLGPNPFTQNKTVTVTVTVKEWTLQEIFPGI